MSNTDEQTFLVKLEKEELDTIMYNANLRLEKLLKEAREHERQARELRKQINQVKPFAEGDVEFIAFLKAGEILENRGMSQPEIEDYIMNNKITYRVVDSAGENNE